MTCGYTYTLSGDVSLDGKSFLPFWGHWEAAERTGRQRFIHNSSLMEMNYNFASTLIISQLGPISITKEITEETQVH
jgi:hypothetical protein